MRSFPRLVAGLAVLGLLGLSSLGSAAVNPPALALHRASAGVDAAYALIDEQGSFRAGPYVSYSLTSAFSLAALGEYGLKDEAQVGRVGPRFLLGRFQGGGQVGAAVNLVFENDERPRWAAGANGSWPLLHGRSSTLLWVVGGAEYAAETDDRPARTSGRLALRWQALGGKPWAPSITAP